MTRKCKESVAASQRQEGIHSLGSCAPELFAIQKSKIKGATEPWDSTRSVGGAGSFIQSESEDRKKLSRNRTSDDGGTGVF